MSKINLPDIGTEDFLTYLQEKGCNHQSYKMYSTIDIVNSTIENRQLYVSKGSKWNDKIDRENFNNDRWLKLNFGRCFSYSASESVAMWMLYGGMKHEGAMIDFDKASVLEILTKTKQIEVGYFNDSEFKTLMVLGKNDFEIQLVDVVYTERKDNTTIYRRTAGEKWVKTENSEFDSLSSEKHKIIYKSKAWDYEQECRLIVSVEKSKLKKLPECDDIEMVRIDLSNINLGNVKRIYAPNANINGKSMDKFKKAEQSNLCKKVDWDLCQDCKCKPE